MRRPKLGRAEALVQRALSASRSTTGTPGPVGPSIRLSPHRTTFSGTAVYVTSEPQPKPLSPDISRPAEAVPALRFRAPNGTDWTVIELTEPRLGTSLIFSSDEGFRRVRRYPDDWRRMEPPALWALSWER